MFALSYFVFAALLANALCFTVTRTRVDFTKNAFELYSKKSSKKSKGFGGDKVVESPPQVDDEISKPPPDVEEKKPSTTQVPLDQDAIFSKYGISDRSATKKAKPEKKVAPGDRPFGEAVLEKIPPRTQMQIDNILVTMTFSALAFTLLCGVAISATATRVVFPQFAISSEIDQIITNFLTPAFTPSLIFLLLCSSTFGLFKFAQISSSQTVYKE